jgi:hypothetical protein
MNGGNSGIGDSYLFLVTVKSAFGSIRTTP